MIELEPWDLVKNRILLVQTNISNLLWVYMSVKTHIYHGKKNM